MAKETVKSNSEIVAILKAPFSDSKVQWRVGSTSKDGSKGQILAYADKRDYEERLDEAFGVNWSSDIAWDDIGLVVKITGKFPDGSEVTHSNGSGYKTDKDGRVDADSFKGAVSQAFKRAASEFGIGRYLYEIESPWVPLQNKRFYGTVTLPDDFLPENERSGNDKVVFKADESKYSSPKSEKPNYDNMPESLQAAMNFKITSGFNEGKTMGEVKASADGTWKQLQYIVKNGSTEEERNAAKTVLAYREG